MRTCLSCQLFQLTLVVYPLIIYMRSTCLLSEYIGAFKENIKDNGGKVADKITDATTHLIVSEWEYNHRAIKGESLLW